MKTEVKFMLTETKCHLLCCSSHTLRFPRGNIYTNTE